MTLSNHHRYRSSNDRTAVIYDVVHHPDGSATTTCVDATTGTPFPVPLSSPGGVLPTEGDMWELSRDRGFWEFDRCIRLAPRQASPDTSPKDIISTLSKKGLIQDGFGTTWPTIYSDQLGSQVGEVKWFADEAVANGIDDRFWLKADGTAFNPKAYFKLYKVLSGGDTSSIPTTYSLPQIDLIPQDTGWYIEGIGGSGWNEDTSDANYHQDVQVRKEGRRAFIRGRLTTTAARGGSSPAFTIDTGYRPEAYEEFVVQGESGEVYVTFRSDGVVYVNCGSNSTALLANDWVDLDGITWNVSEADASWAPIQPFVCAA